MSDQDLKPISSATGTFVALKPGNDQAVEVGNRKPESGNPIPVPEPISPDLEALAAELNVTSQAIGRDLRFKIDMNSGQSVIQVLDRETGELIREIPPDKADISLAVNGEMQLRLYSGEA